MKKRALAFTLVSLVSICLSGCKKNKKEEYNPVEKDEITYDGINLHYNFSDKDMTTFLNDFTHRNMRYDSDSCGEFPVAHGTGFAKNWEAMAVCFQNSIKQVYREDKIKKIAEYLIQIDQDDQGMIYNTPLVNEQPFSEAGVDLSGFSVPQGWPFPSWLNSVNNYLDFGNLEAVHTTEFNFNDGGHEQSKSWHANNGTFYVGDNTGYGHFGCNEQVATQTFEFYRDGLETLLPFSHGIDTRFSPMIDMEIEYNGQNVQDYNIIFKVAGDSNWHVAPQSLYASTPTKNVNSYVHVRQFFDMYLNTEWNHKIVTDLGVQFVGKEGTKFTVSDGKVNFIRPTYDTRQANATYQFILAVNTYFSFTRDIETLIKLMPKCRKGILFLNHALQGETKGLLSLEYMYGHDGVVPYCVEGKENDRLAYHSIGNGYGDLTVAPMFNLEANNYYYQALRAMSSLEEAMKSVENDNPSSLSVKNRIPGEERVQYNYDKDSLAILADRVKTNMEKPIQPQKVDFDTTYNAGEYYYQNVGGFWNPETGRFCIGINEYNGKVLDFGHIYLNLESVCAGIGSSEQQLEIMKWIDGQRIIEGDTSKGKDIYFYDFAPRFNTLDTEFDGGCNGFMQDENFYYSIWQNGYRTWSRQVQNGGAIIAWSYYDLVARARVLGIDSALNRLEEIKKWYLKILDYGGNGLCFYEDYYADLDAEACMEDPDMFKIYSLQASGKRGGGAIGLDSEFIESIIFIRSIPDALCGMDATKNNVLSFTYRENSKQSFTEIYNMKYGDAVYTYRTMKNVMQVFNISGQVSNKHYLTFRYQTDNKDLPVKVNGEVFEDVQYVDGYLTITVPFGNTKVIFG